MTATNCPFCERGSLSAVSRIETIFHNGKSIDVHGFQAEACSHCGEEMVGSEAARANQKIIADACLAADGKLVTGDLKCFRLRHGFNQAEAAEIFGGGQNAFSKYERGEVQQSRAMDLLLRVYDKVPDAREYLRERAGMGLDANNWTSALPASRRLIKMHPRPSSFVVANDAHWENVDLEPLHASR